MKRQQSDREFANSISNTASKGVVMARIDRLIREMRLDNRALSSLVPCLSPSEISFLRAGDDSRFGKARLEKIEEEILQRVAA